MERDTIRSKSITSFTLSPPTDLEKLVQLLVEVLIEALLVMMFASLRSLIKLTAGGVIKTQHGPAIAILHQYAYTGQEGKTIHSSGQLEW